MKINIDLTDSEFYQQYLQNAQHMMWFLCFASVGNGLSDRLS